MIERVLSNLFELVYRRGKIERTAKHIIDFLGEVKRPMSIMQIALEVERSLPATMLALMVLKDMGKVKEVNVNQRLKFVISSE